jgi:hypothetical protein
MEGSASAAQLTSLGSGKSKGEVLAPSSEAKSYQGLAYQGPQLIISNSPHPDNFVQTIRQPDIVAPKLPTPLPLPPLVSIATARPVLDSPKPGVGSENRPVPIIPALPMSLPQQQPKVEAPRLSLPAAAPAEALRTVANSAPPASMPTLAHQALPPVSGTDSRNILIVDAIPFQSPKPSAVPPGELHGSFSVSPEGTPANGSAGEGSGSKAVPGSGTVSGSGAGHIAEAASTAAGGAGHGKSTAATGQGKAARADVGSGTGTGNGGASGGKAASTASTANGRGSGTAAGRSENPFPFVTIQGGSVSGGSKQPGAAKPQTGYGITIVASGSSGGLKDFGVFRNETSYTVYLDMADVGAFGANWTLQYAQDLRPASNSSTADPPIRGALLPPYAKLKSIPRFSPVAARQGRGGTIVVSGVINTEGKFRDLQIMQSPDPGLNQPLLDSLGRWTFQSAEINGTRVPVKVLLGVPVDSLPSE